MEFLFKKKSNKINRKSININFKDFSISKNYKYFYDLKDSYEIVIYYKNKTEIENYIYQSTDYLIIINSIPKNINEIKKMLKP